MFMINSNSQEKKDDARDELERHPFSYKELKDGRIFFFRDGRQVSQLSAKEAVQFLKRIAGADTFETQLMMARATGNYKRGNESRASGHRHSERR